MNQSPNINSNFYKTEKGTELPLTTLKGNKDYLQVAYRVVWFREIHPDWTIETSIVKHTDTYACVKAVIKNELGRVIAEAHKDQSAKQFNEFLTKAETGAIGRALALIGCGTQFCIQDIDEEPDENDGAASDPNFYKGVDSGLDLPRKSEPNKQTKVIAPASGTAPSKPTGPSPAQIKRLWYLADMSKWPRASVDNYMLATYKVDNVTKLTREQYQEFTDYIQSKPLN